MVDELFCLCVFVLVVVDPSRFTSSKPPAPSWARTSEGRRSARRYTSDNRSKSEREGHGVCGVRRLFLAVFTCMVVITLAVFAARFCEDNYDLDLSNYDLSTIRVVLDDPNISLPIRFAFLFIVCLVLIPAAAFCLALNCEALERGKDCSGGGPAATTAHCILVILLLIEKLVQLISERDAKVDVHSPLRRRRRAWEDRRDPLPPLHDLLPPSRRCAACRVSLSKAHYGTNQWKSKGVGGSRCRACVAGNGAGARARGGGSAAAARGCRGACEHT